MYANITQLKNQDYKPAHPFDGKPLAEMVVTCLQIQMGLINQSGSFNKQYNVVN